MKDDRKYELWGLILLFIIALIVWNKYGIDYSMPIVLGLFILVVGVLVLIAFIIEKLRKL